MLLVGASSGYALRLAGGRWSISLGAGVAALRSSYQTVPSSDNKVSESQADVRWAACPNLETLAAWHFSPYLGVGIAGMLGTVTPEVPLPGRALALPETASADAEHNTVLGRPLFGVAVGLQARL
jgi:hypothetical protein